MLSRMERVYLGLLRGFILVAATLALLGAALLVISAVPEVLTRTGLTQSEQQSSSLSEFIAEQRPASSTSESMSEESDTLSESIPADPSIKEAARNIRDYLGSRATISQSDWERGLQSIKNDFPAQIANDYAESIKRLSEELKTSKGKPLSEKQVVNLVDWHKNRFASNHAAEQAKKAEADAAFVFKMEAAFAAFMLFAFITFIFLFVRIERNLRLVRVEVENA